MRYKAVLRTLGIEPAVSATCLYLTGTLLVLFAPFKDTGVRAFSRGIGDAALADYAISRVVAQLLLWLALGAIGFYAINRLMGWFYARCAAACTEKAPYLRGLDRLAIAGLPVLLLQALNLFEGYTAAWLQQILLLAGILLLGWLYILLCRPARLLPQDRLVWTAMLALACTYPVTLALRLVLGRYSGNIFITIYLAALAGLVLLLQLGGRRVAAVTTGRLALAALPLVAAPLVVSIYIEVRNILTQHSIYLQNPLRDIALLYALVLLLCAALWLGKKGVHGWQRAYFPLAIVGIFCFSVQFSFFQPFTNSFFELANHGTAVSQFLLFGRLPIVEGYSAHMLSDFLPQLTFAVLNNDVQGGMITVYNAWETLAALLVYYLLVSRLLDRRFSFLFVVLFPWVDYAFGTASFAVLCVAAMYCVVKRPGWKSYALYALALAFCCLYKLDAGLAYGLGTLAALCLVRWLAGRGAGFRLWPVWVWLAGVGGGLLSAFVLLCLAKGVSPTTRLLEFLANTASNDIWALNQLGNVQHTAYAYYYFLIPILVFSLLLAVVLYTRKKPGWAPPAWVAVLLSLGLAFAVNLQRGMVRHNLLEGAISIILYTVPLFLGLLAATAARRGKHAVFTGVLLAVMLANHAVVQLDSIRARSLAGDMLNRYNSDSFISVELPQDTKRVNSAAMRQQYHELADALAALLQPGQTFVDLANSTNLYALLELENPVYVNQSPILVGSEQSQEYFIEQLRERQGSVPIAITALEWADAQLDNVFHPTRHYRIFEYLYQVYTPLGTAGNYLLWCENSLYEQYCGLVDGYGLESWDDKAIDAMQGEFPGLNLLPYVWAGSDTKRAADNPVLAELVPDETGVYRLDTSLQGGAAYLCLTLESESRQWIGVSLLGQQGAAHGGYAFTLMPGTHQYLIRISANYYWGVGGLTGLEINTEQDAVPHAVQILQGD